MNIEQIIKQKCSFLSEEQQKLVYMHAANIVHKNDDSKFSEEKLPMLGSSLGFGFSDLIPDIPNPKCIACTATITVILAPILSAGFGPNLLKRGLLGVANQLAEASGNSVQKVTDMIMNIDTYTLMNEGRTWYIDQFCGC